MDEELAGKHCQACAGNIPLLSPDEVRTLLPRVPGWELSLDGRRIRRRWVARNFKAAIAFLNSVAALAEAEGHHPDLHLESYRELTLELWTHSLGGLSENDFILAAKINGLPIELKRGAS
jgi:4a-hydroxytetrahydrobiopterin dehydratase